MPRSRALAALLATVLVAACGSTATPAPGSSDPSASSPVTAAASGPPSAAPSSAPTASPSASPTPSSSPTPTVAPTPTPTPPPWKVYTSKLYHYKISYPPDWIVTPGTAKLADQFDNFDYPYIYVTRDVVSTFVSVSKTVTAETAYFKSHYHAKLTANQAIRLAGYSGRMLTFSGTDDGLKVVIKEVIIAKGKIGYFLTMFGEADTVVADRSLFKKMYTTWRAT